MSRPPRPSRRREHVSPVRNGTSDDARNGDLLQFTPNGTRIPAGPPPSDDGNATPKPPPVLPPLPMMPKKPAMETDVKVNLGAYEAFEETGGQRESWGMQRQNPQMKNC